MKEKIMNNKTYLGIELGSTRIKACLIDDTFTPIAQGGFDWENSFVDGYWTYSIDEIKKGVTSCFQSLKKDVADKYGVVLSSVGAIGISAMMHGYLAFDKDDNLLTPFRTWRNTTTEKAAEELSSLFKFNVPQRWSISHLYQAILNGESHVKDISYITTLSGYVHYLLTGKHELGIGDASGMFPVKDDTYNADMIEKFRSLVNKYGFDWDIASVLPEVKIAGEKSATLSTEGAEFLDPAGDLKAGIPMCAPEGDAGTGMVATNSVTKRTGNISAGTSVFAMLVLEKALSSYYSEVDMVTTPYGDDVAMVHCNNCAAELDAWVNTFGEFASLAGANLSKSDLYSLLYKKAMEDDSTATGITAYNYLSGEHITGISKGRPMYFRKSDSRLTLGGFMKAQLYSAFATLKIGMEILFEKEGVSADKFLAHGGLFKVQGVAQKILADALSCPVSVMETASEGGAWGMALLSAYMMCGNGKILGEWLENEVFASMQTQTIAPTEKGITEYNEFILSYKQGLGAEKKLEEVK